MLVRIDVNTLPVLVTRPASEAARWIEALRATGLAPVVLPLIEIAPSLDSAALQAARQHLGGYQALMFVSAAAVVHFFMQEQATAAVPPAQQAIDLIAGQRCWATGPGTAAALQRAGVPTELIDAPPPDAAQFDSEALWALVRAQVEPGMRLLMVRGGDASGQPTGRDWLTCEINAAGGLFDTVVAYRRLAPTFGDMQRRIAAAAAQPPAVWLFSSSEAVANLRRAMPTTSWRSARAIATHPRIAQAARAAGFGTVLRSRPALDALVASIESLR